MAMNLETARRYWDSIAAVVDADGKVVAKQSNSR